MNILVIFSIATVILFALGFLLLWKIGRRNYGVLEGEKIYSDTGMKEGELLYSKSLPLAGKPDYLIKEDGMVFPVEIKSGKTPREPYLNHTTQLMAYCYLVEETFEVRPKGGYLKYPEGEFKLAYTDGARQEIKDIVAEIVERKRSGEEFQCNIPNHKH